MERITLNNIPQREPVLDEITSKQYETDKLEEQWLLITEIVRQEILINSETRKIVAGFIGQPVSETLPAEFLELISTNERVARLVERYGEHLGLYVELDAVPDEQLQPDITHAEIKISPNLHIEYLQDLHGEDTKEFYQALKEKINSGIFLKGVTVQERLLVAKRYRFARDIKMLALQAEASEELIKATGDNNFALPSGTFISLNVEDEQIKQDLLNPENWERRQQIKDRVYAIQAGEAYYILKERKTARHTDTKKGGHRPGLTSYDEFKTAKEFQENGQVRKGNVGVSWEKPLATVKFTDEYQFTVFEYKPDLLDDIDIHETVYQRILENAEQFVEEYEVIKILADKLYESPEVIQQRFDYSESNLKKLLKYVGLKKDVRPQLSFDDFAKIKALRMFRQAKELLKETVLGMGYTNSDLDQYAYKINTEDNRVFLEIFGFDFEYLRKIDKARSEELLEHYIDYDKKNEVRNGIGFAQWVDGEVTREQRAGYLALLAIEGLYPVRE